MTKSVKFLLTFLAITTIVLIGVGEHIRFEKRQAEFQFQVKKEMEDRINQLKEDLNEQTAGYSVNSFYSTALSKDVNSTTGTIAVDSSQTINGEEITFSPPFYITINQGQPNAEISECWTLTTSTSLNEFKNCNRGLSFSGSGSTSTISNNRKAHSSGEPVIQSDVHYTFEQLLDKNTREILTASKTFIDGFAVGASSTGVGGLVKWCDTFLCASNDAGATFYSIQGSNATSTPDGGLGILRVSLGGATTSSVFNTATGTRSGLGFYNITNPTGNYAIGQMQIKTSSTGGLWIDDSVGGLLAVTNTLFIADSRGRFLGMGTSSFYLDADNVDGLMASSSGIFWETGTSNNSTDVRLWVDASDGMKLKFGNYNNTDYQFVLGGAIEGNNTSTVPRHFAAGQTVESDGGVLTITHNLGIIPAWIEIDATMRAEGTDTADGNLMASGTISNGIWVNGESPTRTPLTSSTFSQSLAGNASNGTSGFIQSATTTVFLKASYALPTAVCGAGTNQCSVLANGRVNNVTTSTFQIEWINFLPNFGDAFLQWKMGQ